MLVVMEVTVLGLVTMEVQDSVRGSNGDYCGECTCSVPKCMWRLTFVLR